MSQTSEAIVGFRGATAGGAVKPGAAWRGVVCGTVWLARVAAAGVFVWASVPKIADPAAFALSIHRFQMLPDGFINPLAVALPWVELIAAAALLLTCDGRPDQGCPGRGLLPGRGFRGFRGLRGWRLLRGWRRAGALLLGVLLIVFTIALATAWARGLDIACGCFGSTEEVADARGGGDAVGVWSLIRNGLLLVLVWIAAVEPGCRSRRAVGL